MSKFSKMKLVLKLVIKTQSEEKLKTILAFKCVGCQKPDPIPLWKENSLLSNKPFYFNKVTNVLLRTQ